MGKRLKKGHSGLERIQNMLRERLDQQDITPPAGNTFIDSMLGMPSSDGMDKYRADVEMPPSPERDTFMRILNEERSR